MQRTIRIKRSVLIILILSPMFAGFAAFINMLGNPRFEQIRGIDAVRLIVIGACWALR